MEIVSDSHGVRSTVIIRACKIKYHTIQGICYIGDEDNGGTTSTTS